MDMEPAARIVLRDRDRDDVAEEQGAGTKAAGYQEDDVGALLPWSREAGE